MKTLKLATGLDLPLSAVTESIAILAKRRAGKSTTARRLAEQLHRAGQQVVVADPKGDWWGLRFARDGTSPGLPFIVLGGEHGDVDLEATGGELVARLVVEQRASVILDLSRFRKSEVCRFMTAFMETLYRLKAQEKHRTPVMLIIDEADAIAPQKPFADEARMVGAASDLVRRGGQRGIGVTMLTQRSAVLNKDLLTQVGILIVLQTIAPQDRKAIDAWIDVHGTPEQRAALMESLATLAKGEGWVWAPGWPSGEGIFQRQRFLLPETFDSSKTPEAGGKAVEPKNAAAVDLDAFRKDMAATIEKAKAEDPRELRKALADKDRRIKELERSAAKEVSNIPSGIPASKTVEVLTDADRKLLKSLADVGDALRRQWGNAAQSLAHHFHPILNELIVNVAAEGLKAAERDAARLAKALDGAGLKRIVEKLGRVSTSVSMPAPTPARQAFSSMLSAQVMHSAPRMLGSDGKTGSSPGGVTPVQQRILNALAELEQLGARQPARELVAFMAGYTHLQSKGFVNAMSGLSTAGCITYGAGTVALTEAGRAVAQAPEAPRTAKDVQDRVIAMLGGASGRILEPLIEAYPKAMPRQAVAERAGYGHLQSKGFVNAISRLRTLGFVEYPDRGSIVAMPVLFLEA